MTDKIVDQIIDIRDSGLTNMFDVRRVREIADSLGFHELVDFISKDKNAYAHFILTGERQPGKI